MQVSNRQLTLLREAHCCQEWGVRWIMQVWCWCCGCSLHTAAAQSPQSAAMCSKLAAWCMCSYMCTSHDARAQHRQWTRVSRQLVNTKDSNLQLFCLPAEPAQCTGKSACISALRVLFKELKASKMDDVTACQHRILPMWGLPKPSKTDKLGWKSPDFR